VLNQSHLEPYLSVVVTTRNDDHGGDPLARLQAFVNCFDEQCRRTRLDAEVIVVEWNPPADKARVGALLRLPERPVCAYRFIEVPPELHRQLQHADVLPLFQMIAKNVGIRRARGRFVLATNIDIVLSTELVEYIAGRSLQPRRLYRVDRHDIQAAIPLDAPLELQMAYCASHQLRVHGRSGSRPVDPQGRQSDQSEDVVDGRGVRLGAGWHVRETAGPGRPFRWASDAATLVVDPAAADLDGDLVLDVDLESNPYDAASWVDIAVRDGETTVETRRISGRMRLRVPVPQAGSRELHLCVVQPHPEHRKQLPVFERRDVMFYRLYSATLAQAVSGVARFEYPVERWANANPRSGLTMTSTPEGLAVSSDRRRWSYCVRYGPLRVQRRGTQQFELACTILEGRIAVGILSRGDRFWIPSDVTEWDDPPYRRFAIAVDVPANEDFTIVVSNDHPDGDGVTRFLVHQLRGTCDPQQAIVNRPGTSRRLPIAGRQAVAYATDALRGRPVRRWWSARGWKSSIADRLARLVVRIGGNGLRYRIVRSSPEFQNVEQALRAADAEVRALAPLQHLADFHRFLRDRRPDNLHVNGCGDFQLMAREHWEELRGYPEFETFSMNIDGLFSYIADAAGIREEALPMPIYHLEHEVGSGWSPEGEALLRRRIAERGITWLDAHTVYIWAAYMRWLGRPVFFNGANWGMASAELPERTVLDHAPPPEPTVGSRA
jgi:hypothetical protein